MQRDDVERLSGAVMGKVAWLFTTPGTPLLAPASARRCLLCGTFGLKGSQGTCLTSPICLAKREGARSYEAGMITVTGPGSLPTARL
jgi:hypothetical protein